MRQSPNFCKKKIAVGVYTFFFFLQSWTRKRNESWKGRQESKEKKEVRRK